ncbi:MAG: hypothetical protein LBU06_07530 [Desulfovibrio sp.]|jgi:hypothetical protein|nr:hypothetical protein [Desulfovibrio sp.]
MSYKAIVHRVMISCPGDAHQERDIARDVIYKWNSAHAEATRKIILPIDWLHDAVPDAATSPQESINQQVTDKADMLIAIFRHRIGTPTDEFPSGTVEEIENFITSGKPVLLYFSSADVPPDMIRQYSELDILKNKYKPSSFYGEFSSPDNFRQKLSQHIQQKSHDLPRLSDLGVQDDNIVKTDKSKINIKDSVAKNINLKYLSTQYKGQITFNYSNNNGDYAIGDGELLFELKFSKASDTAIYLYSDPPSILAIASVKNVSEITHISNAEEYDQSSRCRTIQINEIAILKNVNLFYAAIKIINIKDDMRGADNDEITFDYMILPDRTSNFSTYKYNGDRDYATRSSNLTDSDIQIISEALNNDGRFIFAPNFDMDARQEAKLVSSIKRLEVAGLLEAKEDKREIFFLTEKGFELADTLPGKKP